MKFDVVIIGGGPAGVTAGLELQLKGKSCCIVSSGLSLRETRKSEFIAAGGVFLMGDTVTGGEWSERVLLSVRTGNLGNTLLEARHFILATGKFFSRGLMAAPDRVYEPVFGSDVEFDPDPQKWCVNDFFAPQPFESFGVRTLEDGRVLFGGEPADNLYACGEVLAGSHDIVQSALDICRNII